MVEIISILDQYYVYWLAGATVFAGLKIIFKIAGAVIEGNFFKGSENYTVENDMKKYFIILMVITIIPKLLIEALMRVF